MRVIRGFEDQAALDIHAPDRQTLPLVLNSPHSGACYPEAFLDASRLNNQRIRRSEDTFVDELFLDATHHGLPLLAARFPRVYLDVNREPYELDPKMFKGKLPPYANVRSVRVAGGLGTIARVVSASEEIYREPLQVDDALKRIETLYKPYHSTLRRLLAQTHVKFGAALLVDCHSMPSNVRGFEGPILPDVIIGDRFGKSCDDELVGHIVDYLTNTGLTVTRNKPYAGGFITEHYGRPQRGLHAVQIEINRALYMDEAAFTKTTNFAHLADIMSGLIASLGELALDVLPETVALEGLAAE